MKLFSKIAYHSTKQKSLKKFDSFTTKAKAFTGEGAQVHGWGLYLQEDKEINIERYKNSYKNIHYDFSITVGNKSYYGLTNSNFGSTNYGSINGKGYTVPWTDIYDSNGNIIFKADKLYAPLSFLAEYGYDETYNYVRNKLNEVETDESWKKESHYKDVLKKLKFELDYLTKNKIEIKKESGVLKTGHQYEVEIPDDFVFLEEDEVTPYPEDVIRFIAEKKEEMHKESYEAQKEIWEWELEKVNQTLDSMKQLPNFDENYIHAYEKQKKSLEDNLSMEYKDQTSDEIEYLKNSEGRTIYKKLCNFMSDKEASLFLSQRGIDGIHYDGSVDNSCYVIFNCARLKIVREVD